MSTTSTDRHQHMSAEQFDQLPKFVKAYISKLERDVAYYQRKLEAGPEDSDTFAGAAPNAYGLTSRPLGQSETVVFVLPDGAEIEAQIVFGEVRLRAGGSFYIAAMPHSANVLGVKGILPR